MIFGINKKNKQSSGLSLSVKPFILSEIFMKSTGADECFRIEDDDERARIRAWLEANCPNGNITSICICAAMYGYLRRLYPSAEEVSESAVTDFIQCLDDLKGGKAFEWLSVQKK